VGHRFRWNAFVVDAASALIEMTLEIVKTFQFFSAAQNRRQLKDIQSDGLA
jgi:hypothetical protein